MNQITKEVKQNLKKLRIAHYKLRKLEQVDNFKYLVISINRTESDEPEVNHKIETAARLYLTSENPILEKRELSKKTKVVVLKLYVDIWQQKLDTNRQNEK